MPLSSPVARERLHLRRVSYEGFRRDDGLFDIEAHITDHKDRDYKLAMGTRSKDIPVHNMWARVTIDRRFEVIDIEAVTDEMPYPGPRPTSALPSSRRAAGLAIRPRNCSRSIRRR